MSETFNEEAIERMQGIRALQNHHLEKFAETGLNAAEIELTLAGIMTQINPFPDPEKHTSHQQLMEQVAAASLCAMTIFLTYHALAPESTAEDKILYVRIQSIVQSLYSLMVLDQDMEEVMDPDTDVVVHDPN